MKTRMAVVALMAGLALLAALPAAADDKPERGARLAERLQDLDLTDAQETMIADIQKEFRPKVAEAGKELADLSRAEAGKIQAVLVAPQREKLGALKEERKEHREECVAHAIAHLKELDLTDAEMAKIGEIREEFSPKIKKAMEGLHGLLTDEQKKARAEALAAGKKRTEILAALNLSNDQKEKVEAIGKEVGALAREEMAKIRDVLTEGQKEGLAELKEERPERVRDRWAHRIANLKELNLTEEQVTKIAEIRKECRPDIHAAGNKLRGAIRDEMQAILAVLKK